MSCGLTTEETGGSGGVGAESSISSLHQAKQVISSRLQLLFQAHVNTWIAIYTLEKILEVNASTYQEYFGDFTEGYFEVYFPSGDYFESYTQYGLL